MVNATEKILQRLAAADREHQKEAGGCFLFRTVKYVCALVLVLVLADVTLILSAHWRLGLGLAFVGALLGLAVFAWYLAFVRRNRLEHIARLLEIRAPELGSRLINLLQLRAAARDESLAPLTRELASQAVDNYASELQQTELERLARRGELRGYVGRAAGFTLGLVVLLALFFPITTAEVARYLDPFGDHPPFSFTHLEIIVPGPSGTNVLYGKGVVVKVKATGHTPKEVFLTAFPPDHPERAVKVAMFNKGQGSYDQLLDNIRTELVVTALTKDQASLSKQARIGLILTPKLEQAFVQVAPPAYTGLKPEEKPYSFQVLQALKGSEVRIRLQSNRPLREGMIELQCSDNPIQRLGLSKTGEQEVTGTFVAEESCQLRFGLVDVSGLPSRTIGPAR